MSEHDGSEAGGRWARVWALSALALSVLLGVLALVFNLIHRAWTGSPSESHSYRIRIGLFILALILFLEFCRHWSKRPIPGTVRTVEDHDGVDVVSAVLALDADSQKPEMRTRFTPQGAWDFAERFVRPNETRSRMTEEISLNGDHYIRHCELEMSTPAKANERIFVPFLRLRKGVLVDNLKVVDGQDGYVCTLPSSESTLLNAVCIKLLLDATVDEAVLANDHDAILKYAKVELLLLSRCVRSYPRSDEADVVIAAIKDAGLPVKSATHLDLLARFVAQVGSTYAIVADLATSVAGTAVINYTYTEPLRSDRKSAKSGQVGLMTRRFFGLEPTSIKIDASRALKCSSYHLRVLAPAGYLVESSLFYDEDSRSIVRHKAPRDIVMRGRPYFRCRPPQGQSFAHLYTRNFHASDVASPTFAVAFAEKLPGSLGKAWMLAVATAAVIWLFGATWVTGQIDAGKAHAAGDSLGGLDPGAFAFALPVALWAITGYGDRHGKYASALFPQLSIVASMVLSFAALILTLFIKTQRIAVDNLKESVLFVEHPYWIVLLLIALANVAYVGGRLLIDLWRARGLEERPG